MSSNAVAVQRIPQLKNFKYRSRFNRSFPNCGELYPDGVFPIAKFIKMDPGDTVDLSIDFQAWMLYRTSPVMDSLQIDIYCFYQSYKYLNNKYTRTRGENLSVSSDDTDYTLPRIPTVAPYMWFCGNADVTKYYGFRSSWTQNDEKIRLPIFNHATGKLDYNFTVPLSSVDHTPFDSTYGTFGHRLPDKSSAFTQSYNGSDVKDVDKHFSLGFQIGSLPEMLGFPVGVGPVAISAMPFVMYYLICDYYFRNAEIYDSIVGMVQDVDTDRPWNLWSEWQGMSPFYNYKYGSILKFMHPYTLDGSGMTSSFDAGAAESLSGIGPGGIYRASRKPDYQALGLAYPTFHNIEVVIPGVEVTGLSADGPITFNSMDGTVIPSSSPLIQQGLNISNVDNQNVAQGSLQFTSGGNAQQQRHFLEYAGGLKIDTTGQLGTMQMLRTNFQLLKFLEAKNRAGKYIADILRNMFGIQDNRHDERFPELLSVLTGGFNFIPNMQQSETGQTPQGNITTNAMCRIKGHLCRKTSIEDGGIIVVAVIRQPSIVFENRADRHWFQFREMDYRWAIFALLGDEPIYNYEVYCPAVRAITLTGSSLVGSNSALPTSGSSYTPLEADFTNDERVNGYLTRLLKGVYAYQERYSYDKYGYAQVSGCFQSRGHFMKSYRWPEATGYKFNSMAGYYDYYAVNDSADPHTMFFRQDVPLTQWNYSVSYDNPLLVPEAQRNGFIGAHQLAGYSNPNDDEYYKYFSGLFQERQFGTQGKSITPYSKNAYSDQVSPIQYQASYNMIVDAILPVHTAPGLADHF